MVFDKNTYQRELMRKRRAEAKAKLLDNKVDTPLDNKPESLLDNKPDNKPDNIPDSESNNTSEQINNDKEIKVKTESGKRGRPKGKNKVRLPMSPESFADFSVSVDNLALGITSKDSLKDYEKQSIRLAAMEMAKIMDIPIALVVGNYGITMVIPHVSRYVDKQNEKTDWEIRKIQEELKAKGIDIDIKELKFGDRNKIKERIEKELELGKMKQSMHSANKEDNGDVIL